MVCKQKHGKASKAPVPFEQQSVAATLLAGDGVEKHFYCLLAKLQIDHDISILDC